MGITGVFFRWTGHGILLLSTWKCSSSCGHMFCHSSRAPYPNLWGVYNPMVILLFFSLLGFTIPWLYRYTHKSSLWPAPPGAFVPSKRSISHCRIRTQRNCWAAKGNTAGPFRTNRPKGTRKSLDPNKGQRELPETKALKKNIEEKLWLSVRWDSHWKRDVEQSVRIKKHQNLSTLPNFRGKKTDQPQLQ